MHGVAPGRRRSTITLTPSVVAASPGPVRPVGGGGASASAACDDGTVNGQGLLALQRIDIELDQLAGRRRRAPEHAAAADAAGGLARWRAERRQLEQVIAEATATIERLEQDGHVLDTKKTRLEAQLKTVIAPREAEALMHEIATIDAKHSTLDDEELAAMEQQADADAALVALDADGPALTAAVAAADAALADALAAIDAEAAVVEGRRVAALGALDAVDAARYESECRRHQGVGIAELRGRTCSACHVDLSQVEFEAVRAATGPDLPECPHCGRLIVVTA
jgi:predicted  nucleic acid-binding Zn-ribbon protein